MCRLVLNGKFLAAGPTGVHRVARELAAALARLIAQGHPAVRGLTVGGLAPPDAAMDRAGLGFAIRRIGPGRGIFWEQCVLPLRKGQGTLLSLCNIAPVISRDAITMIHDTQVLITPASYGRAFRWWYRLVQPLIGRRHRLVLTVSEFSRQQIVRAGLCPAERVAVVPNGADHVLAIPAAPSAFDRLGLAPRGYVLALGSAMVHKNIAVLLRAFARPDLAGLRLVLFGHDGPHAFARRGIAVPGNVVFAGRVSDGELRWLMEHALALAFPSLTEGFGLPAIEAMQLGCPVVAAPCGAIPEVCGQAATYADPQCPATWAAALARLRDDPEEWARRSALGRGRAGVFTWRSAALQLAAVLRAMDQPVAR